jgi:DNA-directed RNA polymerases I, II, and III subunit RPABC2
LVLKDKQSSPTKKKPSEEKAKSSSPVMPKSKKVSSQGIKRETDKSKKKAPKGLNKSAQSNTAGKGGSVQEPSLSTRPKDEVVIYDEIDFKLQEVSCPSPQVIIGPQNLTRFEKARITGARSLQLSLGAPSLIPIPGEIKDSISLAVAELEARALPISIRRVLPNGLFQDIPIDWLH